MRLDRHRKSRSNTSNKRSAFYRWWFYTSAKDQLGIISENRFLSKSAGVARENEDNTKLNN